MQRCDHRHPQFAQERQNVTTGGPAENTELMLQADDVYVADVEEICGTQIGRQILLLNLEVHYFRILVAAFEVVRRHTETLALGVSCGDSREQVRRKRRNTALARQVVA